MRRLLLLLTAALALVVASPSVAARSVSITKTGFQPSSITVVAGDTVTWTNTDTANHQVVANNGSFSSPVLASKQSYRHTFKTGGTFAYHDGLQPSLKGAVTVIPHGAVWITQTGFKPPTVDIKTGETVTWTNKDTANHQILGDDGTFLSLLLAPGQHYSHTFSIPGSFGYHDGLQPTLKGTVVVTQPPAGESMTLTSTTSVVTYGQSLTLSGKIDNGTAGEKVTITAHSQTTGDKTVQTVTAGSDGSFTLSAQPLVHTIYVAETAKSRSDPLAVDVRPQLQLRRISRTRALLHVSAARAFVHKYGLLQFWRARTSVWVSVMRVRLTSSTAAVSPTVVTSAVFRLHLRHGLRLRVLMPSSQTVPGYVSGSSNVIRS
jgi:plastocyanin